ncbi:ECF transporter S component [Sporosalibacterium faouarense]|uniref:ECF transporter S component n=1 Tax=Sporosalibacterium faouarense TaxID=516123 RepID=UPI00141CE59F|nr:ECF transporter S component [Sporosalibacterium faouarense]MTI46512.1 ECF transporter S component [Bacillota bacterium]
MNNGKKERALSTRKMAIIGVLGGISMLLGLTPLGFIPVGPTNATIMHIPVIIGAIIEGPIVGAMVGLIFGIFSLIRAFTAPTVISPVFYNPLVSILPRVLIGISAFYSYALFKRLGRKTSKVTLVLIWGGTLYFLTRTLMSQINKYTQGDLGIWSLFLTLGLIILAILIGILSYKKLKNQALEVVISAALGTLTNTVGVLGMVYILYGRWFVEKIGGDITKVGKAIIGVGIANGIPETIVAMLIVTSVVMAIKKKV